MKQKILINMQLIILALIAMVSCGSSKNDPDKPVEPSTTSMKILVDSTTVKPVKGLVTIVLNFQGYDEISYMNVTKVMNGYKSTSKYYKRTISSPYTFQYSVLGSDAASFDFEFSLFNEANQSSDTVTVKIDNSAGVHNTVLVISDLKVVSRVTGAENNGHDGLPAVSYTINNRTDQLYNVGGCDLGIVWEIKPGRYGMFFGDTFGKDFKPNFSSPGPNGGSWRSNVLFFSDDTDLSDGLTISGAATDATGTNAREICFGAKNTSGSGDWTSIPTAAVHANGAEYVHYMNIRTWTGWISNYSSLYKSTTQGQTWERCYNVSFASRSNFGQVGYFAKDGYVYMIGTVTGRTNKPHLARFKEEDIENQSEYQFWNGSGWVAGKEDAATPLFDDVAGELSFAYLPQFSKWVLLYFSEPRYEITMRYADNITGPWSSPRTVARGSQFSQLYGSYIHPLSLKGDKLYFVMSMWLPYNTYLMSVTLGTN